MRRFKDQNGSGPGSQAVRHPRRFQRSVVVRAPARPLRASSCVSCPLALLPFGLCSHEVRGGAECDARVHDGDARGCGLAIPAGVDPSQRWGPSPCRVLGDANLAAWFERARSGVNVRRFKVRGCAWDDSRIVRRLHGLQRSGAGQDPGRPVRTAWARSAPWLGEVGDASLAGAAVAVPGQLVRPEGTRAAASAVAARCRCAIGRARVPGRCCAQDAVGITSTSRCGAGPAPSCGACGNRAVRAASAPRGSWSGSRRGRPGSARVGALFRSAHGRRRE